MSERALIGGVLIAGAYLVGSIPFGFLIARARGVDIRAHGSGNIGATNVGRVLGRKWGVLCFLLDMLKGLAPTLAAGVALGILGGGRDGAAPSAAPAATDATPLLIWLAVAAAAVVGHMFPLWLRFQGGKGVATSSGALSGVFPVLTIAMVGAVVIWYVFLRLTRMMGISSVIAAVALPVIVAAEVVLAPSLKFELLTSALAAAPGWPYFVLTIGLAAAVVVKHRGNIARTIAGTELKVGTGLTKPPKPPPASGSAG